MFDCLNDVQMTDYAAWQLQHLAGKHLQAQLAWWKQNLAGAPPLLELPWDKPRPDVAGYAGVAVPLAIDGSVTDSLRRLAAAEHASFFIVLLAAVKAFLARYSGQDDIVVGTPYANRAKAEVLQVVGCLINTCALRTDTSGDPTFQQLLQRVSRGAMQSFAHSEAPFPKVVDALRLDRSAAFNPVFQASKRTRYRDQTRLNVLLLALRVGLPASPLYLPGRSKIEHHVSLPRAGAPGCPGGEQFCRVCGA